MKVTATKYGSLTVLFEFRAGKELKLCCRCDCGVVKAFYKGNVTSGKSKTCGCSKGKSLAEATRKIGDQHIARILGRTFDRWTVIKEVPRPDGRPKSRYLLIRCICGCEKVIQLGNFARIEKNGGSCGCGRSDKHVIHGWRKRGLREDDSPDSIQKQKTYDTWRNMKRRCYEETNEKYYLYGAAGILVCNEWLGSEGFTNFLRDMGIKPEGYSLDRINPEGNYEPANCRWATLKEQSRNRRTKYPYCEGAAEGIKITEKEFDDQLWSRTAIYKIFSGIYQRCYNPNNPGYKNYGGRGIKVCSRWQKKKKRMDNFKVFVMDMGLRPGDEYSLDRIDSDGDYSPDNCRWANPKLQIYNRRKYEIGSN